LAAAGVLQPDLAALDPLDQPAGGIGRGRRQNASGRQPQKTLSHTFILPQLQPAVAVRAGRSLCCNRNMGQIIANWQAWLWTAAILAGAYLAGLILHRVAFTIGERLARRTPTEVDQVVLKHARPPARLLIPVLAMQAALSSSPLGVEMETPVRHILVVVMIAASAWLVIAGGAAVRELVNAQYRVDVTDNLSARRIRTQLLVLYRVFAVVVGFIALASILMTFPDIRSIGAGLFASAGVAGLVLGIALRPVLENLLAGIQIALTEPIRLDDVVVVEGEWGRIEEISATYIVVRIWDMRRLVVPLSHFIQKPFQNWTRHSTELLGTVFVYADYSVPVEEVRSELRRILESSGMWDGNVCGLVVTNATERVVEMRALMSAANSSVLWDLRCLVRERLIAFLQSRYPDSLPKIRAEVYGRPTAWEPTPSAPRGGE
jgi:small-conductance mechanosensitive channel